MAELWVRSGMDPDAPEAVVVAVVIDPDGTPEERAVGELFSYAYEGEDCFMLVGTDGWAERRLQGEATSFTTGSPSNAPASVPSRCGRRT